MKKIDHDYVSGEGIATEDDNGDLQYISSTHRLPVRDYALDIARGKIPRAESFGAYGERTSAGAETSRVLWPNGVFTLPPIGGVQLTLVSTSADDTLGGTNIGSVDIHYLDSNLDPQVELVELNGLTPVLTVATNIRFIQCMHGVEFGLLAKSAGTITAKTGGTTYSQIDTGETRCSSSARMVPRGHNCFIVGAAASSISGTSAAKALIRLVASEITDQQFLSPLALIPFGSIGVQDTGISMVFPVPLKFREGTVIAMTITTDKAATVSGTWYAFLEDV
jgi:hypothetical protein